MRNFISDVYEEAGENRYHLRTSSSVAGVVIDDHKWAYSNHATDPAYHVEANAFDLIRIHKFPHEDEKRSFNAMAEWVVTLPEVNRLLSEEKQEEARRVFSSKETDWRDRLTHDRAGRIVNNLQNLGLILAHDESLRNIVFNELADSMEIKDEIPWRHPERFWRDADDAQLDLTPSRSAIWTAKLLQRSLRVIGYTKLARWQE